MPTAPPLAPEQLDEVEAAFAHINDEHPDTVLFVAHHVGATDATGAELLGADTLGVDLRVDGPGGPRTVRLDLPEPIGSVADLQAQLMATLTSARAAADASTPLTSLEQQLASVDAITVHPVELLARRTAAPNLLELDLLGDPGLAPPGPDAFYFAMVSDQPGRIGPGYTLEAFRTDADAGRASGAYYTARRWDAERCVLTVWVVVHGHPGGTSGWLAAAPVGATFGLWGPRIDFDPPVDAEAVLVVADETGLAAVAAVIEHLEPTTRILAVLEAVDEESRPPMPAHPGLTTTWLDRGDRPAGTGPELLDTVRAMPPLGEGWWAFGGAESRQITAVRRFVRDDLGLPAERVSMTGYWRRGD